MIFDNVNIAEELRKEKNKIPELLNEVNHLLSLASAKDEEIISRLKGDELNAIGELNFTDNELKNIFSFNQIEKICVTYRLRFLDSKYFRKDYPNEAILRVAEFEKKHNTKIKSFKIIAPEKAFELIDVNQDPLLFAQLNNSEFYLIHQWGSDLKWYRKFVFLPIRNIYTYFYSSLVIGAIIAFSFPFSWLNVKADNELYLRMWFTMHCTIGVFFFFIFIGAMSMASFSSMSWKSKYFNE